MVQISYRTYSSYHWSSISLSQHNQTEQREIHNAISEVSKSQTVLNIQRYTPITVDQTAPFETRKI